MKKKYRAKKVCSKKLQMKVMGKIAREEYIEKNPHGFSQMHKVHKSKKHYSRKQKW